MRRINFEIIKILYTTYRILATYGIIDFKIHNFSYLYFFTVSYTFYKMINEKRTVIRYAERSKKWNTIIIII